MAQWALVVGFAAVGLVNSAWQHNDTDTRGVVFDDEFLDGSHRRIDGHDASSPNSTSWNGIGSESTYRRAYSQTPPQKKIWKEIQQEVRDVKDAILPILAENITSMKLNLKDMDRNFFNFFNDVGLMKSELQYIKHQAHVIWENVTDARRDHKRISRSLWWMNGTMMFVKKELEKMTRFVSEIQRNYGTLSQRMEFTATTVSEISEISQTIGAVNGGFDRMRDSLDNGTARMTGEIRRVYDAVEHLTQILNDVKKYFMSKFPNVLPDIDEDQFTSALVGNFSDLTSKLVSQTVNMALMNDKVIEVATQVYFTVDRIKEVWERLVGMSDFLDDIGRSIQSIDGNIIFIVDNIGAVDARTVDVQRKTDNMHRQMGTVKSEVVHMRGDLNNVKNQLAAIENIIRDMRGRDCDSDNGNRPSTTMTSTTMFSKHPDTPKPIETISTRKTAPTGLPLPHVSVVTPSMEIQMPAFPSSGTSLHHPVNTQTPMIGGFIPEQIQSAHSAYPGLYPPQPEYPGYPPGSNGYQQMPGSGLADEIPSTGIPFGKNGPGLPIGCGDRFTGHCVCACSCHCGCPIVKAQTSHLTTTRLGQIFRNRAHLVNLNGKKKCSCLCPCPCPATNPPSQPFPPSSMPAMSQPGGGMPPNYMPWIHNVPTISSHNPLPPPGWLPQADNSRHLDLLNDLVKRSGEMQKSLERMESEGKSEHELTRQTIIDTMNRAFGFFLQDTRIHFGKIIQLLTQALSAIHALQSQLRDAVERAGLALHNIASSIIQFHREMSASHVTGHHFPPINSRPGYNPVVIWPYPYGPVYQPSEFPPAGQSAGYVLGNPGVLPLGVQPPLGPSSQIVHGAQPSFPQYPYGAIPSMVIPPNYQYGVKQSGDSIDHLNRNESAAIFDPPEPSPDPLQPTDISNAITSEAPPTTLTGMIGAHRRLLTPRNRLDDDDKVITGHTNRPNSDEDFDESGEEWMDEKNHGDARRYSSWLMPANSLLPPHISYPFDNEIYDGYVQGILSHVGDELSRAVKGSSDTGIALRDRKMAEIAARIDPLTFYNVLQRRVKKKILKRIRSRLTAGGKVKLVLLGRPKKRTRNLYLFTPRLRTNLTKFLSGRLPARLTPLTPPVGFPHQIALRPPPMLIVPGRLPPKITLPVVHASPYSFSYSDGKGNNLNVNVNRRSNLGTNRGPAIERETHQNNRDEKVELENKLGDRVQNKRPGREEK